MGTINIKKAEEIEKEKQINQKKKEIKNANNTLAELAEALNYAMAFDDEEDEAILRTEISNIKQELINLNDELEILKGGS